MSIWMFLTGFVIFSLYLSLLVWNIYNGHKPNRDTDIISSLVDEIDMDGMGDFTRFPVKKEERKRTRRKKNVL